ncbi:hypothetical protein H2203_000582 [Taxawa tesnikishii (nom. ined.)]|nr:hypothetical protein H2203_000582 [Dothideales sp. JES 119]
MELNTAPKGDRRVASIQEKRSTEHDVQEGHVVDNADQLQRHLGNRQIQLIAVGGSIGTALFVSIGGGLTSGGPGSLFIAYAIYCSLLATVNNSMAEMAVYMPVSGSFIRMAGKWVDESVLNIFAVKYYGEAEFWLSTGKVLLFLIVFCFTFITMVGGNPQHDAFGFRTWNNPGAFAESITTGALGRFEGFLGALWSAAFTIVGPEYLAMAAGETERPRTYLKNAYKTIYWRFAFFFIGGALAVGIILPYNDPTLLNAGAGTAAASPYVIAMNNMGIDVLPHIVNALLVTSIFSAGNAYVYCAMRSLYGLALEGQAPSFLKKCTKSGIPVYCFAVTMIFPFLSLLQVSNNTAQVVTWLANLTEAAQLIDYIIMSVTYLFFYRALKAQGFDRRTLPYRGWFQPYCGWIGTVGMIVVVGCYGYTTFLPGYWDVGTFFSYYTMVFVAIVTYLGWKLLKRTKVVKPAEADLIWDKPVIDLYESLLENNPPGFWAEIRQMIGLGKKRTNVLPNDS